MWSPPAALPWGGRSNVTGTKWLVSSWGPNSVIPTGASDFDFMFHAALGSSKSKTQSWCLCFLQVKHFPSVQDLAHLVKEKVQTYKWWRNLCFVPIPCFQNSPSSTPGETPQLRRDVGRTQLLLSAPGWAQPTWDTCTDKCGHFVLLYNVSLSYLCCFSLSSSLLSLLLLPVCHFFLFFFHLLVLFLFPFVPFYITVRSSPLILISTLLFNKKFR